MSSDSAAEAPLCTQEQLAKKLAKLLVDGPLYKKLRYRGNLKSFLPHMLSMACATCDSRIQNWDIVSTAEPVTSPYDLPPQNESTAIQTNLTASDGFKFATYMCRNCGRSRVTYFFCWQVFMESKVPEFEFSKVGQRPQPLAIIPPVLSKRLNQREIEFYRKALTSRNNAYGLGSLVYLRRIVEDRMNDLLDLLIEAADKDDALDEFKSKVEAVKERGSFDEKIKYASRLLPRQLKPEGINPIDHLHDLASAGIHRLSDDACLDIFDKCRTGFEFVFQALEIQIEHARAYVSTVRKLAEKS